MYGAGGSENGTIAPDPKDVDVIFSGGNNVIHSPQSGQNVHEASIDYMPVHSVVRY